MSNTEALIKNNWAHLHFAEEDGRWQVTIRGVGLAAAAVRARLDAEGLKFSDTTVQHRGETVPAILVLAGDGWSYTVFHAKVMAALIQAKELHAIAGIAIAEDTGRTRVPFTLADLPPAPDESREDLLATVADLQRELLDYKLAVVSCNGFFPFTEEVTPKGLRAEIRRVVEERRELLPRTTECTGGPVPEAVSGDGVSDEEWVEVSIRPSTAGGCLVHVQVLAQSCMPGQSERFVSLIEEALRQSLIVRVEAGDNSMFYVAREDRPRGIVAVTTAVRAVWGPIMLTGWPIGLAESLDISIYQNDLTPAEFSRIASAMKKERESRDYDEEESEPSPAPVVGWAETFEVLGMLFERTGDGYYARNFAVDVPNGTNSLEIEFNCECFLHSVTWAVNKETSRSVQTRVNFSPTPTTPEALRVAVARALYGIDADPREEHRWSRYVRAALGQTFDGVAGTRV